MHYQIIKLSKFVVIIKAISESRVSVIKDATELLVRYTMVTFNLLVLWAALHLQYTSRYRLGREIYYICFTNGQV